MPPGPFPLWDRYFRSHPLLRRALSLIVWGFVAFGCWWLVVVIGWSRLTEAFSIPRLLAIAWIAVNGIVCTYKVAAALARQSSWLNREDIHGLALFVLAANFVFAGLTVMLFGANTFGDYLWSVIGILFFGLCALPAYSQFRSARRRITSLRRRISN